jgi:hypothetical protein
MLAASLGSGCSTGSSGGSATGSTQKRSHRSSGIVELHLLTMPVALNLDGVPGPDGVAVKLFANVGNATKPAAIRSGEIEIVLFDGLLDGNSNPLPKPAHIWTFTAKELKEFETQAMVGTGYQLTLRWGSFKPKSDRVSVIAPGQLRVERPGMPAQTVAVEPIAQHCLRGPRDCGYAVEQLLLVLRDP